MNSIANNMKAVRTFTRIFKNEHNVDGIDHLFASSFKHNFAPLKPGLAGFKDIGRMMNHALPDVVVTEEDLIAALLQRDEESVGLKFTSIALSMEKSLNTGWNSVRCSFFNKSTPSHPRKEVRLT